MSKQRSMFFGKKPRQTPKKDGESVPVPERRRSPVDPGEIDIRFNNDTVTQFGGYPLWDAFAKEIGLNGKLAQHVKLRRSPLGFTVVEAGRFLIDAKVLGCARLMHVETMRLDPMLTALSGMEGLPSGNTLGRILKEHEPGHVAALDRLNTRLNGELWRRHVRGARRRRGPEKVGLDYDSSTFAVYGKPEGADRGRSFRKKDTPGFQPRFAFLAGLGVIVHQELRPQSFNLQKDFLAFHEDSVRRLPKGAKLAFVRGDGALYSIGNVRHFERHKLTYAISAAMKGKLPDRIAEIPEADWEEGEDEKGRPYSIARIQYCPESWDQRKRTYVISRRRKDPNGQQYLLEGEQYRYFAYVTNKRGKLYDQFRFCIERCSLEAFVKEAKLGVHYDRLPTSPLIANRAYLQYTAMAYNLTIYWKIAVAPPTVNRWTLDTMRARVYRVSGNLRRRNARWVLSLPRWWPYRTLYAAMRRKTASWAQDFQ